jgi:hypothetical protein
MDEAAIRALLSRLARPHPSGGKTIERAALLAAGADFPQVMAWIDEHHGQPETTTPTAVGGGLHGSRMSGGGVQVPQRTPQRYVLEAGVLA